MGSTSGMLVTLLAVALTPANYSQTTNTATTTSQASQYQIGKSLEATADRPVPRPHTKPCVVTLLSNQAFDNFNNAPFTYTPPTGCPGPWAKVVFEGDFSIQAGVQFDRTGEVFL